MAIGADGATCGSVSAGCLEDDLLEHAQSLFAQGGSKMIRYCADELTDAVFGLGLGCGGGVSVLLELLPDTCDHSHLAVLHDAQQKGVTCISATYWNRADSVSTSAPQRVIVANDECVYDATCESATRERLLGATRATCVAHDDAILVISHIPPLALTVLGSGEIAEALMELANALGWRGLQVEAKRALSVAQTEMNSDSYAVLLTHNEALEEQLLSLLLPMNVRYIGVLGSRSRLARVIGTVRDAHPDISEEQWRILHAPVGLDIGAESAKEIALSIVSEIVAVSHRRSADSLRQSSSTLPPHADIRTDAIIKTH